MREARRGIPHKHIILLVVGLLCYNCLDIEILQSNKTEDSEDPPIFDAIVDMMFGKVKPPSCSEPSLVECPLGNECASIHTTADGTCKSVIL